MMASILDQLDRLGDEHPDKLLYSYIDLNGDPIESYSYASFLHRTQAIAGHLRKDGHFAAGDRLLLAYPPGLEMICAFFGCVRAGLIPVPVYPPSSRGFQSALYKMVHIAKDCQAAGVLTSRDYHASLKTNLARSGVSASGVDVDYISGLPWIVTEDFVDAISDDRCQSFEDTVSAIHLRFDDGAQGRDGDARKHPGYLSAGHRPSLAGSRFLASAVSRYGADWVLPLSRAERGHNAWLRSDGLHSAAGPLVRRHQHPSGHCDGGAQLRLRLLPARREAFQGEPGRLRSKFASRS